LHQVRALLSGTLIFRLIEWIAAAGLLSFTPQLLLEFIYVPFWLSIQIYELVLVDDHRVVSRGVHTYLESFGDISVIGVANNAEELLARLDEWLPVDGFD